MFGLGELPAEYNRAVHGPYDPAIYYGKKDTKFSDLKLKEVPGWLSRRNKSPVAFGRALSRGYWRWGHKYYFPRNAGVAPLLQAVILTSFVSYLVNYSKISHHKNRKYHW
ncbi:putative ATP synthase subunit f, mitochondrial [Lepeophtheirus salmonis]|uniref:ATP synthase subunit f, mitochondrial n=1 Tax=Lepeophtheirus salmonis TaxID=72036 RepID=C1BTJ0_LEPSM|nr:putative ATP synthase subunit f, mitochondrial [Lepeophtheirus salmonis]ACO12343.1 ATP synthase subunit f, mitochondrial [Lepeophtheirus salmonis]ADD24155.1 ATP synthase subunit f, mitochondrial [Lepeophtheirus salmonis]ADD37967.1 ATP synthase subunit f, mitochondrial [Lepeophtheirus salmonis]